MKWQPDKEVAVLISEREREQYLEGLGPIDQWPHRIGRHEKFGEFPVMVVRQFLRDQGYDVYVSGLSKVGIESYSLAMFPGQRQDRAFANARRVLGLDDRALDQFLNVANRLRAASAMGTHGGDPDLLAQYRQDPKDRFFVEIKAESRVSKDDLTRQQKLIFPLIQSRLRERIVLASVHILGTEGGRPRENIWNAG